MSVAMTIRDDSNETRDELTARATRSGQSLQEYLPTMLVNPASRRPRVADVIARAGRCRVNPGCARRRTAVTAQVVCDASALVALLLDSGAEGRWATQQLTGAELAAP